MEESLRKLDEWETAKNRRLITSDEFLSWQTAEGLRVTLKSMLDMTKYLNEMYGISSVLTGNVNQDALEVCYIQGTQHFLRNFLFLDCFAFSA